MGRVVRLVCAAGFLMSLGIVSNAVGQEGPPAARQAAAPPPKIQRPPLFFREDWKFDTSAPPNTTGPEQEHTVGQGDLSAPNLEIKLYGDQKGPFVVLQGNDDITFVWTGLCTSNCAVSLRDKKSFVDLTGPMTKLRWRTKENGFHFVHPIIKLADGTWLIGDKATGYSTDWVESEMDFVDIRWRRFDPENVVEARDGKWVDNPDLSKVDEIGFTDLMRGSGHGTGGSTRIDWVEVYGKPVPR